LVTDDLYQLSEILMISESGAKNGELGGSSTIEVNRIDAARDAIGPVKLRLIFGGVSEPGVEIFLAGLKTINEESAGDEKKKVLVMKKRRRNC
jgi:hypothetical protein